ncbi:MAG: hypothetical protein OHK93_000723 [Ramalina farinacea]|uniref:NAD(P)-binding protein n=1 Tax=Ramalina farinacea TaxID=258253 RepID=A0AA43QJQ6_9LECA|nr:hypothetical protein [Ramalina farinacea]
MVNLKLVQQSNAALKSAAPGQIALFIGATSGLGLTTLTEYARNANKPKVYIVGRDEGKLSKIIAELQKINPTATFIPIKSEIALFKNVDAACEELKSKESTLDLLVMSPGYLKTSKVRKLEPDKRQRQSCSSTDNADGIEDTISLRYYVRARFVQNLLPLLKAPSSARIVSIHGAGKEGKMDEKDLELKTTFSMQKAAMHTSTMNTLALEEVATTNPTISCVHVFPGVVITPAYGILSDDFSAPMKFVFRKAIMPCAKLMTMGLPESGQRLLFTATSARYPPAGVKEPPGSGVAIPAGADVVTGSDWKKGSGCYLLSPQGEPVGDKQLLEEYRKNGWDKKIWEHTQEVFDRALTKA